MKPDWTKAPKWAQWHTIDEDTPPTRNDGFDWFFVGYAAGVVTIIAVLFVIRLFVN